MAIISHADLATIKQTIQSGGIIAYPTEAVYGLGCDPFNQDAVIKLLQLKKRSVEQGLILIASSWQQIKNLYIELPSPALQRIKPTWPGPVTWLLPASQEVPAWITGKHSRVAIRITAHPVAKSICDVVDQPLVSSSANVSGESALRDAVTVKEKFAHAIDFIVPGNVGNLMQPTIIRDAITGKLIRGEN